MIKYNISEALRKALNKAQSDRAITVASSPEIIIEKPQNQMYGDYASSLPLKLARITGLQPMQIANMLVEYLPDIKEVEKTLVIAPGFINFVLSKDWLIKQVEIIGNATEKYGDISISRNESIQVEYVSVNPTGPLHVGHGRGAVLGSTLANVLRAAGYKVIEEYYINDAGTQLDIYKQSLYIRYKQCLNKKIDMPENGYLGNYVIDTAKEIVNQYGNRFLNMDESIALEELGKIGINGIMKKIKDDLELLGVNFDIWFSERSLKENGTYTKVIDILRNNRYMEEKEGATWFVSTALGDDKDNVLVRSDGTPTYFAYDVAYHYNKFIERKFNQVIDIWGADHHGHVTRMKNVINALGINQDRLNIIICQLVTLKRGSEIIRISKRSGDIITLKEVIDEVGSDACRFVFLSRSADSQMDFDLELAKKQSAENPVYYVQYAHARISSILKLAQEQNIDFTTGDASILNNESEIELIKQMTLLPELIEMVATTMEPHHLPYYAQQLATSFHSFYKKCRVISENREITLARLKLVKAAQIVLARTLHLMGMSAPESM